MVIILLFVTGILDFKRSDKKMAFMKFYNCKSFIVKRKNKWLTSQIEIHYFLTSI